MITPTPLCSTLVKSVPLGSWIRVVVKVGSSGSLRSHFRLLAKVNLTGKVSASVGIIAAAI